MTGRRFVARWALRVLRRDWRKHATIVAFVAVGVCVSVTGAVAAFNLVEPPESSYGAGDFAVSTPQPDALAEALDAQGVTFGRIDATTATRDATTDRVDLRRVDPDNTVTAPLYVLLEGRWPAADDEVAITDRAVSNPLAPGDSLMLGGRQLTVVGLVENPTSLADEFAVVADLAPFTGSAREGATATGEPTTEFYVVGNPDRIDFGAVGSIGISSSSGPPARTAATLVVNVISAFGLLEIGLLAGSTFAVIAQRRSRQFGLLAGAGAPPALLRSAATISGAAVGAIGAGVGLAAGLILAWVLVPQMESTVGHRIDLQVPWWSVGPSVALGVGVSAWAARRPAAALSRRSIVEMLAARRPRPEPTGRVAVVGGVLTTLGAVCLVGGFTNLNTALALVGTLLTPVGLLLLAPMAVATVGWLAARLPLPARLSGRRIARYNRRSSATVAALALALGVPVAIGVVSASVDERAVDQGPNLPNGAFVLWGRGADGTEPRTPAVLDAEGLDASRQAVAEVLGGSGLVPIQVAVPADAPAEMFDDGEAEVPIVAAVVPIEAECTFCELDTWGLVAPDGNSIEYRARHAWVASPELLAALGMDLSWLAKGDAAALVRSGEHAAAVPDGILAAGQQVQVGSSWPTNAHVPDVMVAPDLVSGSEYELRTVGWLGISSSMDESTREQVRAAVSGDVAVEFHQPLEPRSELRTIGLIVAVLIGLGLTASAVGLLAAETSDDLALLSSLGATARTERRISAATAGLLAGAGAGLGVLIGYIPMLPMTLSEGDDFPFVVPWLTVLGIGLVFPLLAALVGWTTRRDVRTRIDLRQSF